ncbi:hypothetical protein GTR04_0710 [Trichophyton interdigitale]|uniref:Uncharacterized protein n=2 Tax=Trichophyton interdigitale TaxID=101480 RepID=A0A9P4YKJ3_9EURO|nr:hypothetical protein GY631_1212 [Trichophyton interdigitale]KAF3899922.1 hypothetical protein GY632_1030 [Trichophyton interdigitale]KAG8211961.1 hypothetical protein GTR04_0710 [Trichophyton interdigitale]KDB24950.1 hypothetical protein H109_03218 [Trichophyton interdigitale MR816]
MSFNRVATWYWIPTATKGALQAKQGSHWTAPSACRWSLGLSVERRETVRPRAAKAPSNFITDFPETAERPQKPKPPLTQPASLTSTLTSRCMRLAVESSLASSRDLHRHIGAYFCPPLLIANLGRSCHRATTEMSRPPFYDSAWDNPGCLSRDFSASRPSDTSNGAKYT